MTPETSTKLLAYSPMMHSRMFHETPKYRNSNFEPLKTPLPTPSEILTPPASPSEDNLHLDGHPTLDRPLFVQFCSNSPTDLLTSARYVAPFCDAVDLNLGCPQGIAKRGKYGAFLQEDWALIRNLISTLHANLSIPVTAKIRILDTKERTLEYAKMVLNAGASIITVHGRQREQKGHNTGLADWTVLRYLRENLPQDTVIFANGNILQHSDVDECLRLTGADAVMSAEGNLYDPSIFAEAPPVGEEGREYWRSKDGKFGGYRMDAAFRRYMDILYKYVLQTEPPTRKALYLPSDPPSIESSADATQEGLSGAATQPPAAAESSAAESSASAATPTSQPVPSKKRKRAEMRTQRANNTQQSSKKTDERMSINLRVVQAHLFHMLRPLVAKHTHVRDALARCKAGDIDAFENVLQLTEAAVRQGLHDYEIGVDDGMPEEKKAVKKDGENGELVAGAESATVTDGEKKLQEAEADVVITTSNEAVLRCRRPWWVMQPYVRPLPEEALQKGAMTLSRKEKERLAKEEENVKETGLQPEGRVEVQTIGNGGGTVVNGEMEESTKPTVEIARDGLVSG